MKLPSSLSRFAFCSQLFNVCGHFLQKESSNLSLKNIKTSSS